MAGFIVLHRKMLEWEWYDDMNTKCLFLHCLLRANHKPKKWRGRLIDRGQFISSYQKLSEELGLSVKQIRGSLEKLERTGEMARESSNQHTVFIIKNYSKYQDEGTQKDTQEGKERAGEGQSKGNQRATNNNENNENNKDSPSGDGRVSQMPVSVKFCEQVIEQFIELCPELPSPRLVDEKRINAIRRITKLKIPGKDLTTIEFWQSLFEYIHKSDFLCGRSSDFKAGIDWIVTPSNFKKIIEGNYENRKQAG